jgi:hypothetical protein
MIEEVGRVRPSLLSPYLASFRLEGARSGDLVVCYVPGRHTACPPAWTEARADPDGMLCWKVLLGFERAARFHSPTLIDQSRCFGAIYRGVDPTAPLTPGAGMPMLSQG